MPKASDRLIVGLGNPGSTYARTRHNIGFMTIDEIAREFSVTITGNQFGAAVGHGHIGGVRIVLAKPMLFMNRSGPPVLALSEALGTETENMLVIHDDMDLDLGRIKIKEKGGHGGHKGIRSLTDALGTGDFVRLRMGIGRPGIGADVVDHVLGEFTSEESARVTEQITRARDAVVTILCKGTRESMNIFNRKNL
ncbi:aminoacyl-tRNA hydrolase [Desulfonema ishimotonii]|uniref:Peptidyl-tRNA hydrolase n=1 Tax=Desulfonema ishimotonii TaxID=45657 RepID=A0A401FYY2_9BACT|nr:aminoacyl-tRNA hydrolase [Desulfonema ishimotonii]GBC62181.1 aminoacyl-tRNA hydrolase [Desulfonema ishimotonii]